MTTETEDSAVDPPRTTDGFFEPPAVGGDDRTRELELRYRGIIDRLPAVLYIDAVDRNQPMIDVSPSVQDLLGIPREEFLSRPYAWTDTIHPDDLAAVITEAPHVDPSSTREGYFESPSGGDDDRLRELELRYRGIIDQLPAVLYVDSRGRDRPHDRREPQRDRSAGDLAGASS